MEDYEVLKQRLEKESKENAVMKKLIEEKNEELANLNQAFADQTKSCERLFDVDGLIIVIFDTDKKVSLINDTGCEILGYELNEIIGQNWFQSFVSRRYRKKSSEAFDNLLKGENEILAHYENRLITKEGKEKVISCYNKILKDGNNRITGIMSWGIDLTDFRNMEDHLRKLSVAVEQSPVIVVITNLDGNIEYVNSKFCEVTGYEYEEVIGKNPNILRSGIQNKEYYQDLWNTIKKGEEWKGELHNRNKSGEFFWVLASISPIRSHQGEISHFIAIEEDITERKKIEKELKQSEERFRSIYEYASDGIFIADASNKNLVSANKNMLKMIGYTCNEINKIFLNNVFMIEDSSDSIDEFGKHEVSKNRFMQNTPVTRKDKSFFYADLSLTAIKLDNRECFVGIARDVTETKKIHEERMRLSKLETIHHMIATVNHEMNQPLAIISSNAEQLMEDYNEDGELYESIKMIYEASLRITELFQKTSTIQKVKTTKYSEGTKMIDLNVD